MSDFPPRSQNMTLEGVPGLRMLGRTEVPVLRLMNICDPLWISQISAD